MEEGLQVVFIFSFLDAFLYFQILCSAVRKSNKGYFRKRTLSLQTLLLSETFWIVDIEVHFFSPSLAIAGI